MFFCSSFLCCFSNISIFWTISFRLSTVTFHWRMRMLSGKKICVINWVPYINCLMSYLFGRFVLFLFTNPFVLIGRCQMMFTNQCFQFTRQTLSHKISNTGNRCWGQVTKVPLRCHSVKIKGNKNLHYFAFFAQLDVFLQRVTSCKYLQALASDPENSYKFPQQFEWVSQLLRAHWPLTQNICGKK